MVKCFYNCVREITADNLEIELNNKVNKTLIEFNYFLQNCLGTSRLLSVKSMERQLYPQAKIICDNARTCVLSVELSRTGMHNQVKLLTLSPHIDSKKSYLNILVKDEFLILHNDWCCGIFIHYFYLLLKIFSRHYF